MTHDVGVRWLGHWWPLAVVAGASLMLPQEERQ